jgi:hypothetical protein
MIRASESVIGEHWYRGYLKSGAVPLRDVVQLMPFSLSLSILSFKLIGLPGTRLITQESEHQHHVETVRHHVPWLPQCLLVTPSPQ